MHVKVCPECLTQGRVSELDDLDEKGYACAECGKTQSRLSMATYRSVLLILWATMMELHPHQVKEMARAVMAVQQVSVNGTIESLRSQGLGDLADILEGK